MPTSHLPVNLPHAAAVARRISSRLGALRVAEDPEADALLERMDALLEELVPFEGRADLPLSETRRTTVRAIAAARTLVTEVERLGIGEDDLHRLIRLLFESLGLAAEGATIACRAGVDANWAAPPA